MQPHWPQRVAAVVARRRGGRRFRMIRRLLAVGCFVAAGALALAGQRAPGPGVAVVALVRDLPAGATLSGSDLTMLRVADPPDGALPASINAGGRLLAGPARKGEIVTDVRLVPADGPAPGPGRVAVPVRPADPGTVELLHLGVHVAVIAVDSDGRAQTLAADAVVLSLPPPTDASTTAKRLVVLAVPTSSADRLAAAAAVDTVVLRFT